MPRVKHEKMMKKAAERKLRRQGSLFRRLFSAPDAPQPPLQPNVSPAVPNN